MNKYFVFYQQTHDIDWFFHYKGKYYHVASNGGKIPDIINKNLNREIQHRLSLENNVCDAEYAIQNPEKLDYSSFFEFAKMGFISIDRKDGLFEEQNYYTVAIPSNGGIPSLSIAEKIPLLNPKDYDMVIDNYFGKNNQ